MKKYIIFALIIIALDHGFDWWMDKQEETAYTPQQIAGMNALVASLDCEDWLCQLEKARKK